MEIQTIWIALTKQLRGETAINIIQNAPKLPQKTSSKFGFKLGKKPKKHLRALFDVIKTSTTPGMLPSDLYYETANKTEANWFYVTPVCWTATNPWAHPEHLEKVVCKLDLK